MPDPMLFMAVKAGGADPYAHSLLRVGMVASAGGARAEDEFFLREPDIRIDPAFSRKHGITAHRCRQEGGVPPKEGARRVLDFISRSLPPGRATLCGWGIGSSREFLRRMFYLAGPGNWMGRFEMHAGPPSLDLFSAMHSLSLLNGTRRIARFDDACQSLGVENEDPNSPLGNARACAGIFEAMVNLHGEEE